MSLDQFVSGILNISTEDIEDLNQITKSDGSIVIKVKLHVKCHSCHTCNSKLKIQGYTNRKLTHSVLANRQCTLIYSQRRYRCDTCGITFSERNPFCDFGENMTYETKINILKDLKNPGETYTLVAKRYNVSPQTVIRTFSKHVMIPRKRMPEVLSIDEHYFPNSDQDSLYWVLLMDFRTGEIVDVLPDRKKINVTQYFSKIKYSTRDLKSLRSELDNIRYVSIDLYANFKDIFRNLIPDAVICADSFHVIKHLTEDFDNVRKRCFRNTDNVILKALLIKFRFVFNHGINLDREGKYNRLLGRYVTFRQIREILFENFPDLEIAYNLKELYIMYNSTSTLEAAAMNYEEVKNRFADSGIPEYNEFIVLLTNWKPEIINSFSIMYGRRINNSAIESKNRQLERLISNANGFVNFERTRNRILYCLNPNDTYML